MMEPFSSSQGWTALALTLLSALIQPDDKTASMPQCLSSQPTLQQLQSTMPPSRWPLFFPPQAGFAPALDKACETEGSWVNRCHKTWKIPENWIPTRRTITPGMGTFLGPNFTNQQICLNIIVFYSNANTACIKYPPDIKAAFPRH